MVSPNYSKRVLIGNWMDRRFAFEDNNNGILPGLYVSNKCEQHRSLTQDTYKYEPYKSGDSKHNYVEKRATRIRNFRSSTASNVKLTDATELNNNYTTTNTLVYDVLPRLRKELALKKSQATSKVTGTRRETDLLQCFGSLTNTRNFAKSKECAKLLDKLNHMQTTYGSAYNRFKKQ